MKRRTTRAQEIYFTNHLKTSAVIKNELSLEAKIAPTLVRITFMFYLPGIMKSGGK
jgi:hypothetical protein